MKSVGYPDLSVARVAEAVRATNPSLQVSIREGAPFANKQEFVFARTADGDVAYALAAHRGNNAAGKMVDGLTAFRMRPTNPVLDSWTIDQRPSPFAPNAAADYGSVGVSIRGYGGMEPAVQAAIEAVSEINGAVRAAVQPA